MSDTTTITKSEANPDLDIPFEPVKLVGMWRTAAAQLLAQGEVAAAGAFLGCARMLEAWISHEGVSVIMCMPRAMLGLIHSAHDFDPEDKESWKGLARAAHVFQDGPPS